MVGSKHISLRLEDMRPIPTTMLCTALGSGQFKLECDFKELSNPDSLILVATTIHVSVFARARPIIKYITYVRGREKRSMQFWWEGAWDKYFTRNVHIVIKFDKFGNGLRPDERLIVFYDKYEKMVPLGFLLPCELYDLVMERSINFLNETSGNFSKEK